MRRRDIPIYLAGASTALAGLPAHAAATEGSDYKRLQQPVAVAVPGKVEVLEFFAYWCPHCNSLEPDLDAWVHKLPADVNFRRMAIAFRPTEEILQRLYFALESLGLVDKLHRKVFAAIHQLQQPFRTEADVAAFAKANGADAAALVDALKGFTVSTKIRQSRQLAELYRLDSIPLLCVQGRWTTSVADAGGQPQMLAVLDELIGKARKGG